MTALLLALLFQTAPRDVVSSVPTGDLSLSAPRTGVDLRITDKNITGPNLQLGRYGNVLRGTVNHRPAEIRFTENQVSGQIGMGAPLNLHVRPSPQGLFIEGMFAGVASRMTIGYGVIEGRMGRCEYHLVANGGPYQGQRTCDYGVTEPVTVRIPRSLAERPPGELVAVLSALFLGQRGMF